MTVRNVERCDWNAIPDLRCSLCGLTVKCKDYSTWGVTDSFRYLHMCQISFTQAELDEMPGVPPKPRYRVSHEH